MWSYDITFSDVSYTFNFKFLNFHILENVFQKTPQRELNAETFAEI